jgi:hypothetical protein
MKKFFLLMGAVGLLLTANQSEVNAQKLESIAFGFTVRVASVPTQLQSTHTSGTVKFMYQNNKGEEVFAYEGLGDYSGTVGGNMSSFWVNGSADLTTYFNNGNEVSSTWWTGKASKSSTINYPNRRVIIVLDNTLDWHLEQHNNIER